MWKNWTPVEIIPLKQRGQHLANRELLLTVAAVSQ